MCTWSIHGEIVSVIFMTRLFHVEAVAVPTGWNTDLCFGHSCKYVGVMFRNTNYDIISNKLGSNGICEWTSPQEGNEPQVMKSG